MSTEELVITLFEKTKVKNRIVNPSVQLSQDQSLLI